MTRELPVWRCDVTVCVGNRAAKIMATDKTIYLLSASHSLTAVLRQNHPCINPVVF